MVVKGNDHNGFGSGRCGRYSEDSEGFGLKVTCNLCVRKERINIEREGAKSCQEQAQKMVSISNSRLPAVDIGVDVVVRVPELDRGRLVPRNILAVVVDVSCSGFYLLGTKEGLLEQPYARSEFIAADSNFIEAHDVPSSSLSLRPASMITSGSKQGFISFHCKRYYIDNKCKCCSKNKKCNSKCHSNSSCKINVLRHCSSLGLR